MDRFVAVFLAGLLAGCAHYQVNASSGTAPAGGAVPGTTVSGGGVQVQTGGSAAVVLIAIGLLAGMAASETPRPPAPAMAPDRRVNEQDCTKPIEDWSANLKCR